MVEITLTSIHLGTSRRVVTLGLDGRDLAGEFLKNLERNNPKGLESLRNRIETVSTRLHYENKLTFRNLGGGLYEFKRPGLRLYAFYDDLPDEKPQLIIATNGGTKKDTLKQQNADIERARVLRERYLAAKQISTTKIRIHLLDHEN